MTHLSKINSKHGAPLALALALAATAASLPPAQAGLFSMSEQDEIKAGQQVAAQAEKEFGRALPDSDPRARRVRAIGMQFAQLSERKNIPFSYKVLNNEKVLNAFAAPGGPVFVTTKLLETTSNDAELAYVLGHETTHIEQKHIVKAAQKEQPVALGVGVLGAILGRGKGGNIIGAVGNIAFNLWKSGYSRKDENEADAGGVRWMAQLGYDPHAAVTMLGKLGDGPDNPVSKAMSDHPASRERQAKVEQLIASENLNDIARRAGGPRLSAGFDTNSYTYGSGRSGTGNSSTGDYYPADGSGNGTARGNGKARGNRSGGYQDDDPSAYPSSYPGGDQGDYQGGYQPGALPNEGAEGGADLGAPLVYSTGGSRVVMAPVNALAQWAGAKVRTKNDSVRIQRGGHSMALSAGSTQATIDGNPVTMSAPADLYNGVLYAPIGRLADGLGATASFNANQTAVLLTLDNGLRGEFPLP